MVLKVAARPAAESEVIDAINETLRALDLHGLIEPGYDGEGDWVWGEADAAAPE